MKLDLYKINHGETCYLSAMADIMRYYEIELTEQSILVQSVGINIFINNAYGYLHIHSGDLIWSNNIYKELFALYGVNYRNILNNDCKEATETIYCYLKKNTPVIVCVDVFELKYHPEYHRKHEMHIITVFGLEDDFNHAWVADNYVSKINKGVYCGLIDNLQQVINVSECLKNPTMLWVLEKDSTLIKTNNRKPYDLHCIDFLNKNDDFSGLNAIDNLIDYLLNIEQHMENTKINEFLFELYEMLITRCGPVVSRKLISNYLVDIKSEFNINALEDLIDAYNNLSHKWKVISKIIAKWAITGNDNYKDRIICRLHDVRNEEEEFANKLLLLLPA